jgi:hypothetical protein
VTQLEAAHRSCLAVKRSIASCLASERSGDGIIFSRFAGFNMRSNNQQLFG